MRFRAAVMKADAVPPERREDWVAKRVEEGVDILVCHPRLVQTGLDLVEFPTTCCARRHGARGASARPSPCRSSSWPGPRAVVIGRPSRRVVAQVGRELRGHRARAYGAALPLDEARPERVPSAQDAEGVGQDGAEASVAAEVARRAVRRVHEARFPRLKHLADFDLEAAPTVDPTMLATLERGEWIASGQPVVLLGDSGKSHLLIGLGIAACQRGLRVRYTTAAALVNELAEAADERTLSRVVARYGRLDLLCLDEFGYVHLDPRGAELLFQVLTEREERASVAVASNAPFSEWGQTFADPRLAAAVVDRLTFRAHIIETGRESYRLRLTRSARGGEPPRESWRLQPLRGWSDDTTRQVPSRDPRGSLPSSAWARPATRETPGE